MSGTERDVLVVGESLVDVVDRGGEVVEHAGGSAANTAVALARLGRPVRLATALADDRYGGLVARYLGRDAVALACDPEVVERTAVARATIGADGAASYEFDLEWRVGPVPDEPLPLAVHACSIGAVLPPGADEVVALLARLRGRATVSYDINARPAVTGEGERLRAAVERVVAQADLVKASDEDLAVVRPGLDVGAAARSLLALGPAVVVVTRGAEGATWYDAHGEVTVAAAPVQVVDTIAAGDTFSAALLDGLWERGLLGGAGRVRLRDLGEPDRTALLAHAGAAAALAVTRPGADPPYRAELERSA
ncbi:PfkB family carbohydrate kinase [Nocardioides pantholopis]|uniref:PfkB family carbohydrate kinase n=1 Tax=Nocardioides pantholopis TaxID=2483798 RepID=UPI000F07C6F0|nr:PfkB family carbohydrate kinase [Nocardioides pantholopis]